MKSYSFLLDLAVILISTKLLGLITKKFHMPQVVGALLAGLIFGPALLDFIKETDFITKTSEIGVIVLMFTAGLETDIAELKKTGKASFIIALIGVLVPMAGGFGTAYFFNTKMLPDTTASLMLQNIFIGVILTATSVSISVETLKELGKLNTKAGSAILGAAIIYDIIGIVALTVITSAADASVNLWFVLLKIAAFFIFAAVVGVIFYHLFGRFVDRYTRDMRRFIIIAFFFCLLLSYCAEQYFGVADITGAYIAGLIISKNKRVAYISSRFETLSYMFLSPMFFASIGLKVVLPKMSGSIILFAAILLVVAILTKIVGCGLGAKMCRFNNAEAMQVGCGMVSRGEVALIVANMGASTGLMSSIYFGPLIVTVIVTTIIAPILLKISFRSDKGGEQTDAERGLTADYEKVEEYVSKPE
ncbi:MAG TPA: cation:proton antiporter [Clostridiales bacterium]|nr:cation:proton antiporter [Clostridiales bacterium]